MRSEDGKCGLPNLDVYFSGLGLADCQPEGAPDHRSRSPLTPYTTTSAASSKKSSTAPIEFMTERDFENLHGQGRNNMKDMSISAHQDGNIMSEIEKKFNQQPNVNGVRHIKNFSLVNDDEEDIFHYIPGHNACNSSCCNPTGADRNAFNNNLSVPSSKTSLMPDNLGFTNSPFSLGPKTPVVSAPAMQGRAGVQAVPQMTIRPPTDTSGFGRRDSVSAAKTVQAAAAEDLARMIKSGATAPPGDLGVNNGVKDKPITPPEIQDAIRFTNSKMHGPSSVHKDIIDAARYNMQHELPQPAEPEAPVPPTWFHAMRYAEYVPTYDEIAEGIPFAATCSRVKPDSMTSVLHIENIPYATVVAEIIAFVGVHAQICKMPEHSRHYAVHIIMERDSGKTMDCYVELSTPREATFIKQTLQKRSAQGRAPKINNRDVKVSVSSQEALMNALFPRAKHVAWLGTRPVVDFTPREYMPGQRANGFEGFMNPEEFVWMSKIAETGERALFAAKAPSRVYETMISILYKYPWSSIAYITLNERRLIFDSAVSMLRCLMHGLQRRTDGNKKPLFEIDQPSKDVLEQLAHSVLACPGFNERQKAHVVTQLTEKGYGDIARGYIGLSLGGKTPWSVSWPFQAVTIIPGTDQEVVHFYAHLLRCATMSHADYQVEDHDRLYMPFGNLMVQYGDAAGALTLQDAARIDIDTIRQVLFCYITTQSPPELYLA